MRVSIRSDPLTDRAAVVDPSVALRSQ